MYKLLSRNLKREYSKLWGNGSRTKMVCSMVLHTPNNYMHMHTYCSLLYGFRYFYGAYAFLYPCFFLREAL